MLGAGVLASGALGLDTVDDVTDQSADQPDPDASSAAGPEATRKATRKTRTTPTTKAARDTTGASADASTAPGAADDAATPASRVAGGLVALQGVVVLAAAVFYLVEAVVSDAASLLNVAMSVLLFLVMGAGLLVVARHLVRRRRWARAPAVTWEVICLPVAYGLVESGRWYIGLPVAAVAGVVLFAVLSSGAVD